MQKVDARFMRFQRDKDSVRHCDRSCPCDILATGLASFYLCPEKPK